MVIDMARPTNKEKTTMAWNAWKRCCKKVDSQGEHFTGIRDRFLRDPVYRESQLAIGWSEPKCKEWDELAKEDHTYKLTPEEKKRYQGQWYLTSEQSRQKMGLWNFDLIFRAAVLMKKPSTPGVRRTSWRASPSRSTKTMAFIFKLIVVGQSLNGIGSGLIKFLNCSNLFLLQLVSFTVDSDPL